LSFSRLFEVSMWLSSARTTASEQSRQRIDPAILALDEVRPRRQ